MNISFREAELSEEDARKILTWRNDPLVRRVSFTQEEISWDSHWPWYQTKFAEGKTHFLFAQLDKEDFGIVRFDDLEDKLGEINIFFSSEYRSKGLGKITIREACDYAINKYNYTKIIAEIKKENIVSIKAFKGAGFTNFKEDTKIIKDNKIPIYICEYENRNRNSNI